MSGSNKIIAPAAVACALGAIVVPTDAEARKPNCEEFKPNTTLSSSSEVATSGEAKTLAGAGSVAAESAKTEVKKEISDEQLAADTKLYSSCVAYQQGMIDEATWNAAFLAYQGIAAPAPAPAPAPAQQQQQQQQPQVVIVQPAASSQSAVAKNGGGQGAGKAVLWAVIGIALVVGIIVLVARGGSDDGGDEGSSEESSSSLE